MNSKVIDLLKSKNYVVSDFLIKNYKVWNLDVDEFIILIYLMNSSNLVCDYKLISSELGMDLELVMNKINELSIKKLLESYGKRQEGVRKFQGIESVRIMLAIVATISPPYPHPSPTL